MKRVYLDNAATTPMDPEVVKVMTHFMSNEFGNPSSTHFYGRQNKAAIERSRRSIAKHLNTAPSEIIFTSGGTEADNMAICCSVRDLGVKHIITSKIEHHAVGHTAEGEESKGVRVSYVQLLPNGHVDLVHLVELLTSSDEKTLVSLMHGNNEIGNLLPLKEVSQICRKYGAYFHSDTVQTMAHYRFDLEELDIDFITGAAHKFHGPKGIGFLYINKALKLQALIHGGSQERGMRGGTENLYGIVGMAKALDIAYEDVEGHQEHVQELKNYMIDKISTMIPGVQFHGDITPEKSLYTVLNVCFPPSDKGGLLLFTLDLKGVAASGGSACTAGAQSASHVLTGINADTKRPNTRFSFSRFTTKEEIDYCIEQLENIFEKSIILA